MSLARLLASAWVLAAAGGALAASPLPEGLYQGGMGSVLLERVGGEPSFLAGRVMFPAEGCTEAGRVVLDVEEQGSAVVGRLHVCQRGPSCESRPVDFLGTWLPAQRALVGFVSLPPGCSSPAVGEGGRVALAYQPSAQRPAARPVTLNARAQQEMLRAEALASEGRAAAAVDAYRMSLTYALTAPAYAGLVRALLATGEVEAARVAADRAQALDGTGWEPWYLRARCDVASGDLEAARAAVEEALARGMHPSRRDDPELAALGPAPAARPAVSPAAAVQPAAPAPKPARAAPTPRAAPQSTPSPAPRRAPDDAVRVEFHVKPYAAIYVNGIRRGSTADDDVLMLTPGRYKVKLTCAELQQARDVDLEVERGKVNIVRWNFETHSER